MNKILSETNKEREKSCGCIIINKNKVLLIKQTKGHWGFPKGHIEKDETEIETGTPGSETEFCPDRIRSEAD